MNINDKIVLNLYTIIAKYLRVIGWLQLVAEKDMATHSSILAWEYSSIPSILASVQWTEEPSGLQSLWGHKSETWLSDEIARTVSGEVTVTILCKFRAET